MRPLILGAAFALMALVSGCQTPHTFATPDASWQSHVGQLKHTNRERTVIGEVVVQQRDQGDFQFDFLKGGSFPLISIRQDNVVSRAEGLLARGHWQGDPASAPPSLRPWLALRQAMKNPVASPRDAFPSWRGQARYAGRKLQTLSLDFPDDGQQFVFQFGR